MAAAITPVSDLDTANDNITIHLIEVDKLAADDWILLEYPALFAWFTAESGVTETSRFVATTISADLSATATTIAVAAVTGFPASGSSSYVKINTEIMEVASWSGTTLTIRRGAMGSTAQTHASGEDIYAINSIVLDSSTIEKCHGIVATRAVS